MSKYEVTGPVVRFGAGETLFLSSEQALARNHLLDIGKGKCLTKGPVEFKKGEVIGYPVSPEKLPRYLADNLTVVEKPLGREKKSSAKKAAAQTE